MKLALLVGRLSSDSGGLAVSVPAMADALARFETIEPHVVGVRDAAKPDAAGGWGPNVHAHSAFGPSSFHWAPAMGATLDRLDPDVLDTQGVWMNLSRVALARHGRTRQPYVVTPRGMLDPWAMRRSAWRKRLVARWFENRHLARARTIRALNIDEARAIRAAGVKTPVAVIPNSIVAPDLDASTRRRPVIRFLGRLHPKKGLEPLLQAWAAATRDPLAQDWRLAVNGWGDPRYVRRLRLMIAELGIGATTSLGGPLFGAAKDRELREAAGFILPSFSEGLPMAILEAWGRCTPVLMTRACNLPEGFADGAALEIDAQPGRLARTLLEFVAMPDAERREMGAAGRRLVETRFDPATMARDLARLYRWAAGGGPAPVELIFDR